MWTIGTVIAVAAALLTISYVSYLFGDSKGYRRKFGRLMDTIEEADRAKALILADLDLALQQLHDTEAKRAGLAGAIDGIFTEKQTWETLYFKQSVEHGNAQSLMMGALEHYSQVLAGHGIEVPVPLILKEVRADFRQEHVEAALERRVPRQTPVAGQTAAQALSADSPASSGTQEKTSSTENRA